MKLQVKIIIAFSSIVILMALVQSLYFQNKIENDFEMYVSQNEAERILYWRELLMEYYQSYGSWDQIQEFLLMNRKNIIGKPRKGNIGDHSLVGMPSLVLVVADQDGLVRGDTAQKWLAQSSIKVPGIHEDLLVNGTKIGEFIFYKEKNVGLQTIEQQFIQSINTSILFGTLISVIIAVILGIIFSNRITKPLQRLTDGIRYLTQGNTSYRVVVETKDEFHQLADAFNEMSMKLKQNEEVRKNLVADVAHELRTPLSVLRGRLESIQEGAILPTQEVIVQLSDEVYRLSRLVNDLQQLSLAEAGKLPLNKENTNINQLTERVIDNFTWLAEEKQIDMSFHHNEDAVMAFIDADRITQAIINIIGNALRHTPEKGKVSIHLKSDKKGNNILIEIIDNGPGIAIEYVPFIFERFYRTDSSRSRDQGGTGLGLSIAKSFVEAHGGTISVESNLGAGTKFIIMLQRAE